MKLSPWVAHLLHRRCPDCYALGYSRGYHRAAVEAERRERLLAAGYSREQVERWSAEAIRLAQR